MSISNAQIESRLRLTCVRTSFFILDHMRILSLIQHTANMTSLDDILASALDEYDAPDPQPQQPQTQPSQSQSQTQSTSRPTDSSSNKSKQSRSQTSVALGPTPTIHSKRSQPSAVKPANATSQSIEGISATDLSQLIKSLESISAAEGSDAPLSDDKLAEMSRLIQSLNLPASERPSDAEIAKLSEQIESERSADKSESDVKSNSSSTTDKLKPSADHASAIDSALAALSAGAQNLQSKSNKSKSKKSSKPSAATPESVMPGFEGSMDDFLSKMMSEFSQSQAGQAAGDGGAGSTDASASPASMDAMLDSMMAEMLSKEYLYQPMKDIDSRWPAWLAEQKPKLSAKQFKDYESQAACFHRIVQLYESEPGTTSSRQINNKVMECMNELQDYGQPPQELVKDLLPPGLFDAGASASGAGTSARGGADLPPIDEKLLQELGGKNGCPTQ